MTTTKRMSDLDRTNAITVAGTQCIVVPAGTRTGGFSKPLSKVLGTPEQAIAAVPANRGGDKLVRRVTGGWQVWQRRRKIGGPQRVCDPVGSHAITSAVGSDWFIDE